MVHELKRSVNLLIILIVIIICTTSIVSVMPTANASTTPKVLAVSGKCELFNKITVKVENLAEMVEQVDKDKIILYLDGYPLREMLQSQDIFSNELEFDLTFNESSKESWNSLLGSPDLLPPKSRKVSVTVGIAGQAPIDTDIKADNAYDLIVVKKVSFWIFMGIIVVVIGLFVWLIKSSDIIRDSGPQPGGLNAKNKPNQKTYSLGRAQMAFWFFLVISSYVFIWMATGAYRTLAASVLALIGISAGTALGATIIDSSKRSDTNSQLDTLNRETSTLETDINYLDSMTKAIPAPQNLTVLNKEMTEKKAQLARLTGKIKDLVKAAKTLPSEGFFKDILSDDSGISFHRFQVAGWTVVLGIIFIASVYRVLAMPDFPTELLALMGISSGTYIGFKFPEKQN